MANLLLSDVCERLMLADDLLGDELSQVRPGPVLYLSDPSGSLSPPRACQRILAGSPEGVSSGRADWATDALRLAKACRL